MATPIFQHGKNAFLAIGYDTSSTLATASASGTTTLTITSGTSAITGESPIVTGGSTYGLFVGTVPVVLTAQPSGSTVAMLSSATVSGTALPVVNLSPYINDISFPQAIESAETTSFSLAGVKTYIVGLKSYSVTFSGHYDGTATGLDKIMNDVQIYQNTANQFVSFVYGPSDPGAFGTGATANASPKYYGQAILTKYDLKSPVAGVITFDAELMVTGAVTRSTI